MVVSFFVVIRFYFYGDQGSLDGDRVSLYVDQVRLHGTNRLMVTGQVSMLARLKLDGDRGSVDGDRVSFTQFFERAPSSGGY